MADCSMSLAVEFITHLVEFCLTWNVPTKKPLVEYSEDNYKYFYHCLEKRMCSICGIPRSDLHHIDAVGMGNNRNTISHLNRQAIQLCRVHYTETHQIGVGEFKKRYKAVPVRLDKYLCETLELNIMKEK